MIESLIKKHPILSIIFANILVDPCCTGLLFYASLYFFINRLVSNVSIYSVVFDSYILKFIFCIIVFLKIVLLPYVYSVLEDNNGFAYDFIKSLKENRLFLLFLFISCLFLQALIPLNKHYGDTILGSIVCVEILSLFSSYAILYLYWSVRKHIKKKRFVVSNDNDKPVKLIYSYLFLVLVSIVYFIFIYKVIL